MDSETHVSARSDMGGVPALIPAPASSIMHTGYSPLRAFQAVVDTTLESSASALSNAVSTSIRELRSGEWLACKSELESTGLSAGPRARILTHRLRTVLSTYLLITILTIYLDAFWRRPS